MLMTGSKYGNQRQKGGNISRKNSEGAKKRRKV
jgi:hypothetical protein